MDSRLYFSFEMVYHMYLYKQLMNGHFFIVVLIVLWLEIFRIVSRLIFLYCGYVIYIMQACTFSHFLD